MLPRIRRGMQGTHRHRQAKARPAEREREERRCLELLVALRRA